jgi:hypothetical protein
VGKGARNRLALRKAAETLKRNFPYERTFTTDEIEAILERKDRLVDAFRDAVGPQGWGLGMLEDFLHQLMFHGALAGVDVDPTYPAFEPATGRGAFIRPKRKPDGLHVDSVEWVIIKHDSPRARRRDARAEAKARLSIAMQPVDPEVREAMRELMAEGLEWAEEENRPADAPEPAAEKIKRERGQK